MLRIALVLVAIGGQEMSPKPERTPPALPAPDGSGRSIFTLDAQAPGFDGKSRPIVHPIKGLVGWTTPEGTPSDWVFDKDGVLHVSEFDAVIPLEFGDVQLHIEYSLPYTPGRIGTDKASSGIVIHGRYEVELLDSYGRPPTVTCCGALKGLVPPVANASLPAPGWQTADLFFRAPRFVDGSLTENPRLTLLLNGSLVLNNIEIEKPTEGAVAEDMPERGLLHLQGSVDSVMFRNLWMRRP